MFEAKDGFEEQERLQSQQLFERVSLNLPLTNTEETNPPLPRKISKIEKLIVTMYRKIVRK